ncbi:MAG: NACHT domain-containing protein, partial [Blastocatellia bacterium]
MSDALRKLILALAAQIPLAGVLHLKWDQVQQRPLLAATLGLLYELAVVVAAFWKKVWAELEQDAIEATADWARAAARNFKPGFRRRYNKEIIHEYGVFNVRGLGLINTFTLKLDQVFVDLRIAPSGNPQRPGMDPIAVKELTGNRPIWEFLRVKRGKDEPAAALAVIGPPGCGKTTLLQHIALTLAANRQRRYRLRAYTPMLLFLRDHVATIIEKPDITLGALAEGYSRKQFQALKPPSDWFERRLRRGKCLVLLDGLDEVAEREKRKAMSRWVDQQTRNYPQCPFIVSSRPQGYLAAPLQRAHIVEVQPFNAGQVRRFVDNWHLANEVVASGNKDDDEVRRRARKDADDLLQRLKTLPSLSALTVNPLLLTMIAMVHRYHGALPGSRVELYNEICEVLLGRWRQARGVKENLTAAQKRSVLQPLAAEMMKRRLREISADEAMEVIRPLLDSVGLSNEQAKTALSDFQAGSGLLLERETGQWSFAHLTFEEFLTAAHWLEDKNAAPDWNEIVSDSWWHETLRLYAAQGEATWIAEACLANDSVSALTLAFECAEEARRLDAETRAEINARLIEGLESNDPKLRRIAAEVRLARRLKSLQRMDDKREIDLTYLTCAEYQLFLDDMRAQGRHCQPDHWTDFTFAKGQAREPVCGVRYEDAEEFCKWLTQRQRGEELFRLPIANEARKWQPEDIRIAAWCSDEQSPVGLAPATEQELERKLMVLTPAGLPLTQLSARALDLVLALD